MIECKCEMCGKEEQLGYFVDYVCVEAHELDDTLKEDYVLLELSCECGGNGFNIIRL